MKEEKDRLTNTKKSRKLLKIATAFAAGAAAGLAVGVLIASQEGSSFRDKVKRFMKEADGSANGEPGNPLV